ncbi:HupE/UreJ family protein [Mesorhizobium sp. J8]|uniref:HupE/UreJ family protein n=1 Tax=Mesorhizobium sp. J8 TaxID=2777475 RepID=UPI0039966A0A
MGLASLFAVFHGHAHASEATRAALAYVAGFTLSTAALHGLGVGVGLKLGKWPRPARASAFSSPASVRHWSSVARRQL